MAANGLRRAYGETVVLDGVDLSIGEGEVFALLGPNGAGKTTTIRILSTLIAADAGTASVLGHDLRGKAPAVRAVIGVTGVALLVGFRPQASVADWFAVAGIVAAFSFALAWLGLHPGSWRERP